MTTIRDEWSCRAGDLVLVDLEPVCGTEQAGTRPCLVLSTEDMNQISRRAIVCPVTRNRSPWPTKVMLPAGLPVEGAVLVDQVRAVDRAVRMRRFLGRVPDLILAQVHERLADLMGLDLAPAPRPEND